MINRSIAILLSGRGSNFFAIHNAIGQGTLDADIGVVISDKKDAAGFLKAKEFGYDALFVNPKGLDREAYDRRVVAELDKRAIALVCLAGFMRILSPYFVRAYPNRILNIHPSLLPAFPGMQAQRQALEYGVKYSGCTVHLVNEGVDSGPIVLQSVVPVENEDTVEGLSERILREEHKIYPQAIQLLLDGKVRIEGRRVCPVK